MFDGLKKAVRRRLVGVQEEHAARHFKDIGLELQRRALESTGEYVTQRMRHARVVQSRFELLDYALRETNSNKGLVCEFGVYKGESINHLARLASPRPVYGFDSFEGLPEQWRGEYDKGHFSLSGALPLVEENVNLVVGYFDKTLPRFLDEHQDTVSFAHIDCDLYSSTVTILEALAGRLEPGVVLVFDEYFNFPGWEQDEYRAFQEFISRTGRTYEYLAYNARHEQVAMRLL